MRVAFALEFLAMIVRLRSQSMKLYFLRHTEAEDGSDDEARALTKRGRNDAVKIGTFLRQGEIKFDAAYTSPLVRARQTGEIVLRTCECLDENALALTDAMRNETSSAEFFRWLTRLSRANNVLLVGHAPTIGERTCELLGIPESHVKFSKGALACVETEDRRSATLKFFVTPKIL